MMPTMCKANDEAMTHIFSECQKLFQKEYNRQYDWMGKAVHWDICRKKDFNVPRNGTNTNFYLVQKGAPGKIYRKT